MTAPLAPEQVAALRQLRELWRGVPFCLIGASALGCLLRDVWRRTHDLDMAVAVSVSELRVGLSALPGWRRNPRREHEWIGPGEVKADLVPAAPELLAAGEVVWPESGNRMSLVGFRLAFERAIEAQVTADLAIPVAPLAVIVLLKVAAYLDRPAERERDLEDLGHVLEGYVPAHDARRFADDVIAAGMTFEQAPAFLLGRDLSDIVDTRERSAIEAFVAKVRDERDPAATQARMARVGPAAWHREPEELLLRIEAFEKGLGRK